MAQQTDTIKKNAPAIDTNKAAKPALDTTKKSRVTIDTTRKPVLTPTADTSKKPAANKAPDTIKSAGNNIAQPADTTRRSRTITSPGAPAATGNGTIKGQVFDATNNQAIPFATVSLIRNPAGKELSLQTDMNGNFTLSNVADGTYTVRVVYVGYLTVNKSVVLGGARGSAINLGAIKLGLAKNLLKEVTVTAQKSQISLGIDKKTFSVDQSLVSQGGSATDLLSNVPTVQVDVDGNVSLRGSSNVKILINGKPSAISGNDLADVLQSIPASAIESIEVITNPSSKYDAEGDSGIINIILKKNTALGLTGSASASAGTHNTYNGTLNLAYQNKKVNIYTNFSYRRGDRVGNGSNNKTTTIADTTVQQNQVNNQTFTIKGYNIRSGIDYNIDPKTTISFSDNINIRDRNRVQAGGTSIAENGVASEILNQNNHSTSSGNNLDFNLDFDHKYKKTGEELTANVGFSTSHDNNFDYLNTNYNFFNPDTAYLFQQDNHTIGHQHNWNLQADYTLPLNNHNQLGFGYRSTFSVNDNNYIVDTLNNTTQGLDFDPLLSNHFIYNEQIHAVYGNYQQQFGNFGIQVGLRLEDAIINTQLIQTDTATQNNRQTYLRLYPSIFLSEKLGENQTIQLSYSRRVTRPRGFMISPFLDKSDPLNYTQGNPFLLPQDIHSFELSYINYWKSLTLTSSLYYRLTNDNIQRITVPYTAEISLTQFENVKSASNAGYELIAKVSPSNVFDLTGNLNVYYKNIAGSPNLGLTSTSGFAWNANLTANIKATKALSFQLRGDYQGPQVIPQGRADAVYGIDGGFRYDISKKLSFSLNGRDLLNTRKFASSIMYDDEALNYFTNQYSQRRFSTGVYIATLTYHFGSTPKPNKKEKKQQDQQQQDQDNNPNDQNPAGDNGGGGTGNQSSGGGQAAPRGK
jgi:outer membrane receptor protein involved in Fe transport